MPVGSAGPFGRFTERARSVVVNAQDEARRLNHNFIGTEHILLGLLREGEGVAARALEAVDISLDAARREVEKIIGHGSQTPSGHIPFTPRAKKVLELAYREAWHLGHLYIGTEHILLGLIREGNGVACQVLTDLGADQNRVRQKVIQMLAGHRPGSADLARPPAEWEPDADIAATDADIALHEELGRLHHEVARLRGLLLRHGIQPDEGHQQTA
jgi:ATP-dependent Clp protease ATP-binding subunit ClpC